MMRTTRKSLQRHHLVVLDELVVVVRGGGGGGVASLVEVQGSWNLAKAARRDLVSSHNLVHNYRYPWWLFPVRGPAKAKLCHCEVGCGGALGMGIQTERHLCSRMLLLDGLTLPQQRLRRVASLVRAESPSLYANTAAEFANARGGRYENNWTTVHD